MTAHRRPQTAATVVTRSHNLRSRRNNPARQSCRAAEAPLAFPVMSIVNKLHHTRYRVTDLAKSVDFYKQVLGLEEVRRSKSPRGSELVFLKAPQSEELIELCFYPDSGAVQVQEDLTHLGFEVDSLEEFGKHIAALGVEFSDGPTYKENGGGFAFVDAPEGYEIELIERPKDVIS